MKRILGCGTLFALCLIVLTLAAAPVFAKDEAIKVVFNDPYNNTKNRDIQNMILNDLRSAEERIDLVTYNYSDTKTAEALIDAAKRGIEVNLVIDEDNADDDVIRKMEKGGVNVVTAVSDGLMHAKYIIVDDDITISGSANMTLSSFSYDNNFMIRIVSSDIAEIFRAEFSEMFDDQIFGENSPHNKPAEGVQLSDGTLVYVRFSPDDYVDDTIEKLIGAAEQSVYMLAYSFSSNDISEALQDADDNGVDVGLICEDTKAYTDGGGECGPLAEDGVNVHVDGYEDTLMHEKAIVLDDSVVIAGSYNYTRAADQRNDEQVLVIQSKSIADQFMKEYDKILAKAK